MIVFLQKSNRKGKKYKVVFKENEFPPVHFGSLPYQDYTSHKDIGRKTRYLQRHQKRENWTKSGIGTSGFWSRWISWSKPTIEESIKDIEKRFNIIVKYI